MTGQGSPAHKHTTLEGRGKKGNLFGTLKLKREPLELDLQP